MTKNKPGNVKAPIHHFDNRSTQCLRWLEEMMHKLSTFGLVLLCSVFFLILFVSHRLVTTNAFEDGGFPTFGRTIQSWSFSDVDRSDIDNTSAFINAVVSQQRRLISEEMAGYKYPNGRYGVPASGLSDLVPELGGQPLRNLIITTWRSGSTFLGDILNSHPGNYYHYEPLLHYDISQIRGPPHAKDALSVLRSLLNCNYTGLGKYLEYGKTHEYLFSHNNRLWEQCQQHPNLCWLPEFLNPFCKVFPFQSMKVVRMRLSLIEELLSDTRLNVRVLLLVRDPRGTLQSRKHRDWCPGAPDCERAELLCADLLADYSAAMRLSQLYPSRFIHMRYEDICNDTVAHVKRLFEFYGLDFHENVAQFLDTHTKVNLGGVSSTFRNTKSAPFMWRYNLTHREVLNIQKHCKFAMKHWGYVMAENKTHQREFNPIRNYSLS